MEYVWIVLGFLCNLSGLMVGSYILIQMVARPEKYVGEGKLFYIFITVVNLIAVVLWVSSFLIKITMT